MIKRSNSTLYFRNMFAMGNRSRVVVNFIMLIRHQRDQFFCSRSWLQPWRDREPRKFDWLNLYIVLVLWACIILMIFRCFEWASFWKRCSYRFERIINMKDFIFWWNLKKAVYDHSKNLLRLAVTRFWSWWRFF